MKERKFVTYMKKIAYKREKNILEKQNKSDNGSHSSIRVRSFVFCLIAAFILYMVMLYIERSVLNSDEKVPVYVTGKEIVKDTLITEENAADYLVCEERSVSELPQGYITDIKEVTDMITDRTYAKNEVITISGFVSEQDRVSEIENPVEVSLNANTLSQVVGGVLRAGDYINIWSVQTASAYDLKTTQAVRICSHAYVTRAFTSSGVQIDRDATEEQATTVINIVIPADKEEEFNLALANGTIRVGRCLYDGTYIDWEESDNGNGR